jgi:hypothetical protein
MDQGLIDEYRIAVYPVVLGSGKRLFRSKAPITYMRLRETRAFASGIVLLSYEPAGGEPTSPYVDAFAWTKEQIRSLDAAENVDRVLATVLFTDIVDSTGQAAAVGDGIGARSSIDTIRQRGTRSSGPRQSRQDDG